MDYAPSTPSTKKLDYYEFVFSGRKDDISISLDLSAGDTILFTPTEIKVSIASKPHLINPKETLQPEDVTIFTHNLLAYRHRVIEITPLSAEQQFEWHEAFTKTSSAVN